MKIDQRLNNLEAQHPKGPFVVVYEEDAEQQLGRDTFPARLATAQAQVGPYGTVIIVEWDDCASLSQSYSERTYTTGIG